MTQSLIRIELFTVAPGEDAAFIAAWEGAGDERRRRLHRALRSDVDFRFVEVARVESGLPGAYEVVHEHGRAEDHGGVVLIDPFEVPAGEDEPFLAGWGRARDLLAQRPGYLGTRLHRGVTAAEFRFVSIARWSSPLAFARALQRPEIQAAAAALPYPSHPALYLVVRGR